MQTDPIIVTISTQGGDGKLLGNLLGGITTLINFEGVSTALNNVLATTVDLVNSVDLSVDGVGRGRFDTATKRASRRSSTCSSPRSISTCSGLVVDTSPIHLTITAHVRASGLVLGNVVDGAGQPVQPAAAGPARHRLHQRAAGAAARPR